MIANNQILFNQNFNQGQGASGGGLLIAGELPAATTLTLGTGDVTVDANLIQGNQAGSGQGGGVRTQLVNGEDVSAAPNNPGQWWSITMTNNMIVNNVAGWSGGGISMQDTANGSIVLNTIANNDSTGTAGAAVGAGPQPAGISSQAHSLGLDAAIPGGLNSRRNFSNPDLTHNIIWHNRAFTYDDSTGTARLLPELSPAAPGDCAAGANYFDLGVLDPAFNLNPRFSILTNGSGNNISADPQVVNAYCNTARTLSVPGPMQVAAEVVEGGNAIDVRYGPLTLAWGSGPWDYHITGGSPAINRPGQQPSVANSNHDIDNQPRPNGPRDDVGSDEYYAGSGGGGGGGGAGSGSAAFTGAAFSANAPNGSFNGSTLSFGTIGGNGTATATVTVTVSTQPVTFGSVSLAGSNRFSKGTDTCTNQTISAGSTCTIVANFSYSGNAVRNGQLTLPYGGAGSPKVLSLTGR